MEDLSQEPRVLAFTLLAHANSPSKACRWGRRVRDDATIFPHPEANCHFKGMTDSVTVEGTGSTTWHSRNLFGGAMTVSLPEGFVDVSTLRQLPDTQECWANAATDQSVVIEILKYDDDVRDEESAKFYLDDIAECNDAGGVHSTDTSQAEIISSHVGPLLETAPKAPNTAPNMAPPSCWRISGIQHVAKFKEAERNAVFVHLAVVRIPTVDSDVVAHLNQPLAIDPNSSSTTVARATPAGTPEDGASLFSQILASLTVCDWTLFRNEEEMQEGSDSDAAGEATSAG